MSGVEKEKSRPFSFLEALQLLGTAVGGAGLFLALYVVTGRFLVLAKPSWGARFAQFFGETVHVDIVHHFGAALGKAALLVIAGAGVVFVTGRIALRRGA
jgi:hypothetical protein